MLQCSAAGGVLGTIYPLVMAAALGIGDGVLMTQINALLGMLFKHDMVIATFNCCVVLLLVAFRI